MNYSQRARELRLVAGIDCPFCGWVTLVIIGGLATIGFLCAVGVAVLIWWPR